MVKKSKKKLLFAGLVILMLVGVVIFAIQKEKPESATSQPKHCTTNNGTLKKEQCSEDYIGLSLNQAAVEARENGLTPKTVKKDGKNLVHTDEGSASIYFEVENDIVAKAYF